MHGANITNRSDGNVRDFTLVLFGCQIGLYIIMAWTDLLLQMDTISRTVSAQNRL